MDIKRLAPENLSPSEVHVRQDHTSPKEALIQSVEKTGLINVLIGVKERGTVRLIDGVQRARAAREVGLDAVPVWVKDLSRAEARIESLLLNSESETATNIPVVVEDRDASLDTLSDETGEATEDIEYEIALTTETERIDAVLGSVDGIGQTLIQRIAEQYTLDELLADPSRIETIDGVGPTRRDRLLDALETYEP
jgi:ParB-like chromosome segregation protein Spo0J